MAGQVRVNEKGFTVLYEAPNPAVEYVLPQNCPLWPSAHNLTVRSVVFVHGFTGHPKTTWTSKTKEPSTALAKRPGREDNPDDGARRPKIPRLQLFGRSPSACSPSGPSTAESSRTPTADVSNGTRMQEAEGQQPKNVYWPADLACQSLPDSRILTYGYDTKVRHWMTGPISRKTVYDHAWDLLCNLEALRREPEQRSRPLLFIAHSLGGIVVKEALRSSWACRSTKPHVISFSKRRKA